MNDLIQALNEELASHGQCVAITRLQEPDGRPHYTAHLHLQTIGRQPQPQRLADMMAMRGCHDITVAHVLHDATNGTRAGYTEDGARHWAIIFRRADERTRAQTARVLRFLASPRGAQVDHVSLANAIELAGIAADEHRLLLAGTLHSALLQAGWARYPGASAKGQTRPWLYKRPAAAAAAQAS